MVEEPANQNHKIVMVSEERNSYTHHDFLLYKTYKIYNFFLVLSKPEIIIFEI